MLLMEWYYASNVTDATGPIMFYFLPLPHHHSTQSLTNNSWLKDYNSSRTKSAKKLTVWVISRWPHDLFLDESNALARPAKHPSQDSKISPGVV